ncbi:MAG: hypothetical protein L3J96_02745, partial [Thermoplasmata archaeon]|nr:hypothetical protein [Thermoplasmata archaeon]
SCAGSDPSVPDPTKPARPKGAGQQDAASARELTPAESRVISTLLAADAIPERERIRASGLSPRTYETARRRIFAAGWVYERFVPDPLAWGLPYLRLDVLRPGPVEEGSVSDRLAASPGAFHVWRGAGLVFAASFVGAPGPHKPTISAGAAWRLDVDLREPSVPIFFDFEGAWSRVVGAAPRVYPRPVPSWSGAGKSGEGRPSAPVRREAEALIRRPFAGRGGARAGRHLGSWVGFGGGRRAMSVGLVQRRCFLDLARLPGFNGWHLQSLAFLKGDTRPGEGAETLYHELLADGGMTPFLFATDRRSVLIGALSPAPPTTAARPRARLSEILARRLASRTLVTMQVSSLVTPVDHWYDRILTEAAQ